MSTVPPSNAGGQKGATVLASLGMSLLMKAGEIFPAGSKERLVILEALAKLEKSFQGAAQDLTQQAAKLISSQANPAPVASPEQAIAMQSALSRQKLGAMAPAMAGG